MFFHSSDEDKLSQHNTTLHFIFVQIQFYLHNEPKNLSVTAPPILSLERDGMHLFPKMLQTVLLNEEEIQTCTGNSLMKNKKTLTKIK